MIAKRGRQRGFIINPFSFGSAPATDPNFSNVVLLCHFDGANGSTTLTDSGPLGMTVTPTDGTQIRTDQSKFGGASVRFDGAGDYATVNYSTSPIGTGDFTVEYWMRPLTIAADYNPFGVMSGGNTNCFIGNDASLSSGAGIRMVIRNDAQTTNVDLNINATITALHTWFHVACVADGSTARVYVDGVQRGSAAITGTRTATFTTMNLGYLHSGATRYFNGYMDDLRVTKGVCRYPSGTTFTPPTAAFPNS